MHSLEYSQCGMYSAGAVSRRGGLSRPLRFRFAGRRSDAPAEALERLIALRTHGSAVGRAVATRLQQLALGMAAE